MLTQYINRSNLKNNSPLDWVFFTEGVRFMQMQLEKKHVLLGGAMLLVLSVVIAFVYPMPTTFIGGALLMCMGFACILKSLAKNPFKYPLILVNQRKVGRTVFIIGLTIMLTFCSIFGVESQTTGQENFVHVAIALVGLFITVLGFYIADKASDEWEDKWD